MKVSARTLNAPTRRQIPCASRRTKCRDLVSVHVSRHTAHSLRQSGPSKTARSLSSFSAVPLAVSDTPLAAKQVLPEADVPGMSAFLDSLKWDNNGLIAVVAQVRPCKASDIDARLNIIVVRVVTL